MRNLLRPACLLVLALLSTLPAAASKGSWDDVKALYPGTALVVRSNQRHSCALVAVDDAGIVCDTVPPDSLLGQAPTYRFRVERPDIRSVRLARSRPETVWLRGAEGMGVGLALGAIALAHPGNSGGGAIGVPLVLAILGAGIGATVGNHGTLAAGVRVYER